MKQHKQLDNITLEDVAAPENPYAPYKRPSEVSAVIAAMMTKVHDLTERVDELEKLNGTTNQ